jgi:hypothetical protein
MSVKNNIHCHDGVSEQDFVAMITIEPIGVQTAL